MSSLGLYFHVPFCGRKCGYCDFYSVCYRKEQAELYIQAVLRNLQHYSQPSRPVDTVYFGGGTPSLLTPEQLSAVLDEVKKSFTLEENAEITLEANPSTLTGEKLRGLRKIGINRLSVGVQSMNDEELSLLGRTHTAARAEKVVREAADAGFGNISCDLMLGLPGQTAAQLRESVGKMAALPIQHISAYILKIEEGTPFDCGEIRSALPDEDQQAELLDVSKNAELLHTSLSLLIRFLRKTTAKAAARRTTATPMEFAGAMRSRKRMWLSRKLR